jgi:hypothetical protein
MADLFYDLLVDRLAECCRWQKSIYVGLTKEKLLAFPCVRDFCTEHERYGFDDNWHLGRVRFFVEQLHAGVKLDPISVDNVCNRGHVYAVPVLLDGHHRLAASCIAGARTIAASYGGRVDLRRYLTGDRATIPTD